MIDTLRKNFRTILMSLLFGALLWFLITTEQEYIHQVEVPLKILRLANGKTLAEPVADKAILEIKGTGQALIIMNFYQVAFNLELPEIDHNTTISLKDYIHFLDLPQSLQVIEIIEPLSIDLKVDDFIETKKPVKYVGNIAADAGYVILDTVYSVDSVAVEGSKGAIDTILFIPTVKTDFGNRKIGFKELISLRPPVPELVQINPREIGIEFNIQRLIERMIYGIPIKITNVPKNLEIETTPATLALKVKGGEKLIEKLNPDVINAEIDFQARYRESQKEYAASIKTPENITWLESIPKTFKLKVRRR